MTLEPIIAGGGYVYVHLAAALGAFAAGTWMIVAHRYTMMGLYFGGVLVPGTLAFLPGRVLHQALLGS